jgi:hypothetical protein
MKRVCTVLTSAALCLAMSGAVSTQGVASRAAQRAPSAPVKTGSRTDAALSPSEPVFTLREVAIINGWFREHRGQLPANLARRESLPPGLARQIQKNGKLPPGLDQKTQPVPPALEKQLVVLPSGYRRQVIGADVIIINATTGIVMDIVRDVIL